MGRVDLARLELEDRLKPVNWFGNIDRNDVRTAQRAFSRQIAKLTKSFEKANKSFDSALKEGDIEGILPGFSLFANTAVHQLESDVHALLSTILVCRREVQLLEKERKDSNLKGKDDREYKMIQRFGASAQGWFNMVVSHSSLTFQLSDRAALRNEMSHILDVFNLQSKIRSLVRIRKRVEKAKKKLTNENYPKLEKDLQLYVATVNESLGMLDTLWKDAVKLMQLEEAESQKRMLAMMKHLQDKGYPQAKFDEVKRLHDHASKEFTLIWKNLEEQVNALVNITRAA